MNYSMNIFLCITFTIFAVLYDSSCPVDFLNNGGVHSGVILAKAHYSNITEYVDGEFFKECFSVVRSIVTVVVFL